MRRHDQRLSRVSEGEEVVEQAGIRLQEYQHMLPVTNDERNKYTSLLAHAYKRVSTLACAQEYAFVEHGDREVMPTS